MNISAKTTWFFGGALLAMVLTSCMAAKFQSKVSQWDQDQVWELKIITIPTESALVKSLALKNIQNGASGTKGWEMLPPMIDAEGIYIVERRPKN